MLAVGGLVPAASAEDAPPSGFPKFEVVEASKGSADATRVQVERITALLGTVETAAAEASQAAVGAAAAYTRAERAVRDQQAEVDALARERERRVGEREASRRAAGRIASTAYKGGSTMGALDALAILGDAGLSRLSTLEALGDNAARTVAAYHTAANSASAAEDQSRAAEEELSRRSAEAGERLADARTAQRNAQDAVATTQGQSATLRAQLAELDATAAAAEAGYREGQDALAAYAAAQEAKRRAAEEAAARAAAQAQGGSQAQAGSQGQGPAQSQAPAGGTPGGGQTGPPAPQAPAPQPQQPPAAPVPAPQPPAPQPPAGSPGVGGVVNDPAGAKSYAAAQLPAYGWGGGEYACLVWLWNRESNWLTDATNPYSGAYGIPQALPPSKYSTAGPDWLTNYRTQITWGLGYIRSRYGSPCAAWAHSESLGWY